MSQQPRLETDNDDDGKQRLNRRRFLQATGVLTVGALTGCLPQAESGETVSPSTVNPEAPTNVPQAHVSSPTMAPTQTLPPTEVPPPTMAPTQTLPPTEAPPTVAPTQALPPTETPSSSGVGVYLNDTKKRLPQGKPLEGEVGRHQVKVANAWAPGEGYVVDLTPAIELNRKFFKEGPGYSAKD